ncbi:uncharacterized protein IUM83_10930 [Phytophthora cinnamomi]|uniref:uncharacterized protein n=1 Tax=Phytophthora cinnamomi TaxID=4785 RepID=UPI00355A5D05|nr:hypothetical protein IUM83_10930 [Phytophthora cinnamomi]
MASAYQYRANNESLFALAKVMEVTCEEADCVEWCKEVGLIDKTKFCHYAACPCGSAASSSVGAAAAVRSMPQAKSAVRLLLAWFMRLAHGQASDLADVSERAAHNWDSGKQGSSATSNTCAA